MTKAYMKRHFCIIGFQDNQLVSASILKRPDSEDIGIIDFTLFGLHNIIKDIGLRHFIRTILVLDTAIQPIKSEAAAAWHVEMLAVNKNYQGKGLGSQMIHNGIIPFVKEREGKTIALITNTEPNHRFYIKNGFKVIDHRFLSVKHDRIDNWTYQLTL